MREDKLFKNKKKIFNSLGVFFIFTFISFSIVTVKAENVIEKVNSDFFESNKPSFSINIEKNPIKTLEPMFDQQPIPPDGPWILYVSDADEGLRMWDDYWDILNPICGIHWWGCSIDFFPFENCNPEGLTFEIIFWDYLLGNPICTNQVSPIAISTGQFYSIFELLYWEVILDPCCDLIPNGWVSIQSIDSQNDCMFYWATSEDGNLYCYQEGSEYPDGFLDCAFQLPGPSPPPPPKIECDPVGMNFGKRTSGTIVAGHISIYNVGVPGSYLKWHVDTLNVPNWATWSFTPEKGTIREGENISVHVIGELLEKPGSYNGNILIYNSNDMTDFCEIDTSVIIPRERFFQYSFFRLLFKNNLKLERIINNLMD